MQQNPGTVEDLFRLCTRMVQRCPTVMGTDPALLREMVLLAIKACEVRQTDALDATTFFLKTFYSCDADQVAAATVLDGVLSKTELGKLAPETKEL